ncbi:hypothetical protein [Neobacillus massiliamazoniensis]|uniref:Phage tail assembly protein n=1 Tax=Neobacillus massiliamazoniensis TaxID=1499688 RepID=A0A0U1NQJ2_9BACI|nr:hypothetical protein [Neobacillus massiliamazoniensis]CRK80304.1 hypothetical protein BN000_00185 [Neobacillus massiliamazoniensis]
MAQEILDLDKLIPEQRIIRLAGKEIDVSKIPSRVTLEIAEKSDVLKSGSNESFPLLLDMIVKICKPSQPDINSDWLIDHTSLDQLLSMIEFILKPIQDRAKGNGKNEESPSQ